MKRTIEIISSFTGKISTGAYENESPFFSLKEIIECENGDFTDEMMRARQTELQVICRNQFNRQAEVAYSERVAKQYQNLRFYDVGEEKFPSVTSIIGWDADFHVSPEELAQYAARGTIIDKQVEIYLTTGEWKLPKEIPEVYPELVILSQGNLGLATDDVDFRGFFTDYPFKVISCQNTRINKELKYAGRDDIFCLIESKNPGKWEKVEGILFDVPTILDVKSGTIDKVKHLKQQTAYAKCDETVKQIGLIPLTKDNKCGYAKPIIETDLNKYWHLFLRDRQNFKKRFGI